MLLHFIHPGTSLCQLFSPVAPEAQRHNANADKKAEKAGLQAASYEQSQPEGNQRAAAELILSAHKNTPCTKCMQGVCEI